MEFFEYPLRLLHVLWIAPLFGALVYWITIRRRSVLKTLFGCEANESRVTTLSLGRRYIRLWLLLGAILLLCVAYARPRWGWRILPFSARGRDLMILMDVSKSMLSEDVRPSRLKHAKQFVRELVESTPGNRYGLVDFAGTAFLECPMTIDKTSLFQALDELDTDSIPVGGTNLENALKKAMTAFKAAEGGYKAVILITDGDELYGDSSKVVSKLKKLKIPLFVVGIGDPTGDGLIKMTGKDGKMKLMRDSMGKLVKSRLNEKRLEFLAERTGGVYVRSTETHPGLAPIRKRIKALVPKEYSKGNCKRPIERFHYPLVAAILLLLARLGIGERKRRNPAAVALLPALLLLSIFLQPSAFAQTIPLKSGSNLPTAASFPKTPKTKGGKAVKVKKPLTPVGVYNQALELQKKNKLKESANLYRKAVNMSKVSQEVRSKAFQNLGVISHKKGEALILSNPDGALKVFDKAEQMYKEAMRSDVSRKRVVLNQQRLLDDRRLAKMVKKRREEMRKKREQARKNTQKALNQQKKENQKKKKDQARKQQKQKKDKSAKKNQQKKQSGKKQKQQSQKQKENDKNKQSKSDRKKQGGSKQKRNQSKSEKQKNKSGASAQNSEKRQNKERKSGDSGSNAQKKETERKIDQARKSVDDFKQSARAARSKKEEKLADDVKKELDKAKKEQKQGKGEESEKHLKKALDKLARAGKKKKGESKDKNKNSNSKAGNKKKSQGGKGAKKRQAKNKPLPKPNKAKREGAVKKGEKEKKIDPAQAAALLDLMANDEKKLRDAIKENQKRNAGVSKVPKDW